MSWPLYQVDAFTAEPFAGNPAAVCLLEGTEDPGWMQRLAAEMNLSETPSGAGRRASWAWGASTTWSSWPTRRPCAASPPTSGASAGSAPAG